MARIEIMHFAEAMEAKLAANDKKKGMHGWHHDSDLDLFDTLSQELWELREAIYQGKSRDIMAECADVANMAMMIFDNSRRYQADIQAEAEAREGSPRIDKAPDN